MVALAPVRSKTEDLIMGFRQAMEALHHPWFLMLPNGKRLLWRT